ncbi:hypothetical protein ACFQE7_39115 [Nonomuraea ferruginea]|uniref:hypothetical protein n=1 Tax=Nonomuraea ferruginea TaxID=46174 RepID=UPI00361BD787
MPACGSWTVPVTGDALPLYAGSLPIVTDVFLGVAGADWDGVACAADLPGSSLASGPAMNAHSSAITRATAAELARA